MSIVRFSKIKILQLSLSYIGKARGINDLNDLDEFGTRASEMYDLNLQAEIEIDYWPFANAIIELNRLSQTPIAEWGYAYQLPANYLTTNSVVNSLSYAIYEDKLYSNSPSVTLNYRMLPASGIFTNAFVKYFTYSLAADCSMMAEATEKYYEKLLNQSKSWRIKAISSAGKSKPNRPVKHSPFIQVRQ